MIKKLENIKKHYGFSGNLIIFNSGCNKKDAMVKKLLPKLLEANKIKKDTPIIVGSSGNMAKYLAINATNRIYAVLPRDKGQVVDVIKENGGEVFVCNSFLPYMQGPRDLAEEKAKELNAFHLDQITEQLQVECYKEIFNEGLKDIVIDAYFDNTLTGGTMAGMAQSDLYKEQNFDLVCCGRRDINHYKNMPLLSNVPLKLERLIPYDSEEKRNKFLKLLELEGFDITDISHSEFVLNTAVDYLLRNPNKTVLVYVGDSPVYGEDVEI